MPANQSVHGELEETLKKTYIRSRNVFNSFFPDVSVSVGARLQANNNDEIIITQDGHTFDILAGNHQKQTFNINIICFSKSYVNAAKMADVAIEEFGDLVDYSDYADVDENGHLSNPEKSYHYIPRSQLMYYTDEDDFAVAVKLDVVVTRS